MRDFEKISWEQFQKDIKDNKDLYQNYFLPSRSSSGAAGYDFFLIEDVTLNPGEIKKIPTGIKSHFIKDEVLLLLVRSRYGFKYNIRLCNQVGVIDADYYNNPENEGHIWFRIQNEGNEKVTILKNDAIIQGLFFKYLTTTSDNNRKTDRIGRY